MKRIKVYIVLLIVIFSGYIFSKEIKNYLFKEEVNLLYKESDFIEPIDWDEYKSMFPEDFSPTKVIINIEELSKLNVDQKKKYDSIRNKFLKYPRKTIRSDFNFGIAVSDLEFIQFKKLKQNETLYTSLSSLNFIEIDSMVKLMSNIERLNKLRFNIIYKQSEEKAILYKVTPVLLQFD